MRLLFRFLIAATLIFTLGANTTQRTPNSAANTNQSTNSATQVQRVQPSTNQGARASSNATSAAQLQQATSARTAGVGTTQSQSVQSASPTSGTWQQKQAAHAWGNSARRGSFQNMGISSQQQLQARAAQIRADPSAYHAPLRGGGMIHAKQVNSNRGLMVMDRPSHRDGGTIMTVNGNSVNRARNIASDDGRKK